MGELVDPRNRLKDNIRKPWYHPATQQAFHSMLCAFPGHFPQRTGRILRPSGRHSQNKLGESKHTSNEQGISRKHHPLIPILHEETYTILRMTGCVQGLDGDPLTDLERLPVFRG